MITGCTQINKIEKIEGANKNGQYRDTGNIGHRTKTTMLRNVAPSNEIWYMITGC